MDIQHETIGLKHYSYECAQQDSLYCTYCTYLFRCPTANVLQTFSENSYSQQPLVCLLLVSLVGYIR